ncbi:MAG: hypothetical protein HOL04_12635 [Gammaproteobacteria bacterium]|jgi:hypothetical protein|nr:hypothetical protein [Gammaproteobacteria bacterium]MBT4606667.1 hypothetical protein [Thiotrichales bacterium]MBT3968034.1 hypothetical protein [Gammaproteobacteria bacterium]MBT4079544.1 hypothetical protein [Gammaproteobacteria bacterium]MBT4330641.1 hypothetical protein [Gammaproteobacteria bacterium]
MSKECNLVEHRVGLLEEKMVRVERLHSDLSAIKWMFAGAGSLYVLNTIGLIEFIKLWAS